MPKCSVCGTSKFFLKLTNGLCNDCQTLFTKCEDKYKALLVNANDKDFNKDELILNILALSVDVRKFDNKNINGLSSKDCETLLDIVKNSTPSISISDNSIQLAGTVKTPISKKATVLTQSSPKETETSNTTSAYDNTRVDKTGCDSIPVSTSVSNSNISSIDIDILTLPNTNVNTKDADNTLIDMSKHLISDFNDDVMESVQEELNKMPKEIIEENPIIKDTSSNFSLSSIEKTEIFEFLNILDNNTLSLDERAYALFTLKEKYLDVFDVTSLSKLFEVDFNLLYDETLRKLSIALGCPKDKVYSLYNYVAFSIQTTGIKIHSNAVIEIAGVRVCYGQIKDTFHSLVNPLQSISLATEDKTKISNISLSEAQPLDIVLQEFVKFCADLDLVTHNVNFNYKFLDTYSQKLFRVPLGIDTVCTVKLYRTRYKQFHGEPTKDCSLLTCCEDLLAKEDLDLIENTSSIALSSAIGTFKLYEIIKTRYK